MSTLLRGARLVLGAHKALTRFFQTQSRSLCPINVGMPSLSPTMVDGTIVQWHKKEGDEVAPGDLLCEIQTDKAVVGMEVDEEGVIAKIVRPEGSVNKIGDLIAILCTSDEDWKEVNAKADAYAASLDGGADSCTSDTAKSDSTATQSDSPSAIPEPVGKQPPIGPAVRLLLSSYGISSAQITGTGPNGTVLKGDVLAYVASKGLKKVFQAATPVPGTTVSVEEPKITSSSGPAITGSGYTDIPVSGMRATIAKRLLDSKSTIPHVYTSSTFVVNRLFSLQKAINEAKLVDSKISINDLILKACAYALRLVPEMNGTSSGNGSVFQQSGEVDICVAVSTPTGLVTPIIKSADRLPVSVISALVKDLATRARDNKLKPEEFTGGSFTISNLGMFGVREFSAIINPPQVGILAIGSGQSRLRLSTRGDLEAITTLTLTLSSDARFVDELTGARFLRHVQNYLESNPQVLFEDDPHLAAEAGCRDLSVMAF